MHVTAPNDISYNAVFDEESDGYVRFYPPAHRLPELEIRPLAVAPWGGATPADKPARRVRAGYRPGASARMPLGAPKANPSPYEPLASAPRRGTLLGGCREQTVVQGRRMRLYGPVSRPAPVPHVRWTRPDAKQARSGA